MENYYFWQQNLRQIQCDICIKMIKIMSSNIQFLFINYWFFYRFFFDDPLSLYELTQWEESIFKNEATSFFPLLFLFYQSLFLDLIHYILLVKIFHILYIRRFWSRFFLLSQIHHLFCSSIALLTCICLLNVISYLSSNRHFSN